MYNYEQIDKHLKDECPKMKSKHQKIKEKQKFHEEEVNEESQNEENDEN